MKNKEIRDIGHTAVLMLVCISINYLGKSLADNFQLPLWMDSVGTGASACILGPFYGVLCGITNNMIYGMQNPSSFAYALTSAAMGFVIGKCRQHGMLRDWFGIFSVSALVSLVAVCVSTPLNIFFFHGYPGNVWGNAVLDMLENYHFPMPIAAALAELLVDFPDKVVTMCLMYALLSLYSHRDKLKKKPLKAGIFVSAFIAGMACMTPMAGAAENESYRALYTQTIYNGDNGLVGGEANDIVETKDGYLWIGTYSGLYRYDGSNFEAMKESSDMQGVKNVNCLFEDEEGRLWIGTNDNGISIYVRDKVSNILTEQSGLASNSIRCIAEDASGNYYIGTSDALCIVSMNNGLKVKKVISEINYARSISVAENGDVAVVNNSGELFLLNDTNLIDRFVLQSDNAENFYTCCSYANDGSLLVGTTQNRLYLWSSENGQYVVKKSYQTGSIQHASSIAGDDRGNYWLSAENGVGYLEGDQFRVFDSGKFNSSIDHMTVDYQGNLWFTSSRLGLLKLSKTCFSNVYRQYNMGEDVVNTITKWQDRLYIGTDNGLRIVDETKQQVCNDSLTKKMQGKRIRCLMVDDKEHLWIAVSGDEGLVEVSVDGTMKEYNPQKGTISNRFRTVTQLQDGTIAATENTGIDFIRDGKVICTLGEKDGLENPQILCLTERKDGTILAGSDGSGIIVIEDYKVKKIIQMQDGLSSDVILRMVALDDGYLFVTSNGLCYMDNEEKCRILKNFPYSNNYDAIVGKDGKVWVLGSAGIYIVSQKELLQDKKYTYELLDGKRGLESSLTANSWNYVDEQGNYYVSCNSGVYMVSMTQYNKNKTAYRMWLNDILVDDTRYYVNKSEVTKLAGAAEKIEITPVFMNYTKEDPYISYYLKGFEKNKTTVRQSELGTIVYTNLPAGTYTFVISVLDHTGEKEIESSSYTIEKPRQFWENWWFQAYYIFICVLIVMYLTWLFTRLQSNRVIRRQNQEIAIAKKEAQMGNETILAIAKTVDAKDENTSQHSERVAEYSVLIAERMGWSQERCEALRKIALLHDIGKIGIPDAVLNKPSRLTDEEYGIMKSHVLIGADILKDFTIVQDVADGAKYHHERYDGKGYAQGLKGEKIPINARIIGIADAFDAMTSNRVYRNKMDMDYVMSELHKGSGTQFDPNIAQIMISLIEEGVIDPVKAHQSNEDKGGRV